MLGLVTHSIMFDKKTTAKLRYNKQTKLNTFGFQSKGNPIQNILHESFIHNIIEN